MKNNKTKRGFDITEFTDSYGAKCSLQKSSSAMEDKIWFGANEIGLKHFKAYEGWTDVELTHTMEEHYVANNRMHLTRKMVKDLLPYLIRFADTGDLHE
jgi:hypothetical protein